MLSSITKQQFEDAINASTSYRELCLKLAIPFRIHIITRLRATCDFFKIPYPQFKKTYIPVVYSAEILAKAVANATCFSHVQENLGVAVDPVNYRYIKSLLARYKIDISHLTKGTKRRRSAASPSIFRRYSIEEPRPNGPNLRQKLLKVGVPYSCTICGISEWEQKKLTLHVDHIDGDRYNSTQENLRFLCPNCHSQTATYAGKRSAELRVVYKRVGNCLHCGNKTAGGNICMPCSSRRKRRASWPSKEELERMIKDSSMLAIGKAFGVSDAAVRRWCVTYGIEYRRLSCFAHKPKLR